MRGVRLLSTQTNHTKSQGAPGEKGQKGDVGQPAIDVFQAVKVFIYPSNYYYYIRKIFAIRIIAHTLARLLLQYRLLQLKTRFLVQK